MLHAVDIICAADAAFFEMRRQVYRHGAPRRTAAPPLDTMSSSQGVDLLSYKNKHACFVSARLRSGKHQHSADTYKTSFHCFSRACASATLVYRTSAESRQPPAPSPIKLRMSREPAVRLNGAPPAFNDRPFSGTAPRTGCRAFADACLCACGFYMVLIAIVLTLAFVVDPLLSSATQPSQYDAISSVITRVSSPEDNGTNVAGRSGLRGEISPFVGGLFDENACNSNIVTILEQQAHDSSLQQRRSMGRGLYAVAAGASAVQLVNDTVSHFLSFPEFDVVVFAYDGYNWSDSSLHPWAALGVPRVRIIRGLGYKYVFAAQHLPAGRLRRQGYSHLFLWDDDMRLLSSFNARDVLRTLQLAPQLKVAQPYVTGSCHLGCWASAEAQRRQEQSAALTAAATGSSSSSSSSSSGSWAHFLITTPEIMVPIYAVDAWGCFADLVDPRYPEAWGLDTTYAGCLCSSVGAMLRADADAHAPGQAMLLTAGVEHMNLHSQSQSQPTESQPGQPEGASDGSRFERARAGLERIKQLLGNSTGGKECNAVGMPIRRVCDDPLAAVGGCLRVAPAP